MWIYNNEPLTEPIEKAIGFVYLITNLTNGKKYIGKKLFHFSKTKQVKGKKKKYKAESDWKTYWSSSDILQKEVSELGENNFKREILHICFNKGMMSYLELREQIDRRVLESDDYYNGIIQVRIHKSHVKFA